MVKPALTLAQQVAKQADLTPVIAGDITKVEHEALLNCGKPVPILCSTKLISIHRQTGWRFIEIRDERVRELPHPMKLLWQPPLVRTAIRRSDGSRVYSSVLAPQVEGAKSKS